MNLQVIKEKENPLLKRKEILASLDYEGGPTPSKGDLQKFLAEHFKVNPENVEISKIMSEIGMPKGKVWIKIWQEKKVPIYAELKKKEEKPKEEEKSKEEKPKEELKSEEKKEEKTEEKPEPSKEKKE